MLRTCTFVALAGVWLAAIPECMSVEPTPGTYFVALNGNDAWSGTLPEPNAARTDGPFLTLDRARDAVRAADRNLGRAVVLRGGTYYLTAPLRLGPEDSGTAQHPVVYQAYPGETVRLSGGRPITGWQDKGNGVWAGPVPEAAGRSGSCASAMPCRRWRGTRTAIRRTRPPAAGCSRV